MPRKLSSTQQQIPLLHREFVKAVTSSVKKGVRAYSKGQSCWRNNYDGPARLSLRHFKSEKKNLEEQANEFQSCTLSY